MITPPIYSPHRDVDDTCTTLDIDSLPPYEILDPILQAYVEEDQATSEIIDAGYDAMTVKNTVRLVTRTEYKRRQAPPLLLLEEAVPAFLPPP